MDPVRILSVRPMSLVKMRILSVRSSCLVKGYCDVCLLMLAFEALVKVYQVTPDLPAIGLVKNTILLVTSSCLVTSEVNVEVGLVTGGLCGI